MVEELEVLVEDTEMSVTVGDAVVVRGGALSDETALLAAAAAALA